MKKAFLLGAMVCALGVMTACKSGTTNSDPIDTIFKTNVDTLWADDHGYWEIKEPFEENGRTVLYRSCSFEGQIDGSVDEIELSYYLLRRGTEAYDSILSMMQSITAKDYTEGFEEGTGVVFSSIHMGDVPRHWYSVCKYKGEYYLYQDGGCGLYLSDGAIVPVCGDFYPYQLKRVVQMADGGYQFQYETGDSVETAEMKPVNKARGLYLYSDTNFVHLFTVDSHLCNYDIIMVDGSTLMGIDGIEFDE